MTFSFQGIVGWKGELSINPTERQFPEAEFAMKLLSTFLNISIAVLIIYSVGMVFFGLPIMEDERRMIYAEYIETWTPEFFAIFIKNAIDYYAQYFPTYP